VPADLTREESLHLVKFVCSFVWADGVVADDEIRFVRHLVEWLKLSPADTETVDGWLKATPGPVDPMTIPRKHRELFLESARLVIASDRKLAPGERQALDELQRLMK
jgi:hypothetical protein